MTQTLVNTWQQAKKNLPNTVILIRYCEEYYTLNRNARILQECGCRVLCDTERDGIEYTSFHYTTLSAILPRIIRLGNKVAIADLITQKGGGK